MSGKKSPVRVGLISLGCVKNLIDSEHILGALGGAGYVICGAPEDADAVIINTCAFIEPARIESWETIDYALSLKKSGAVARVIVAGCLSQRFREKIFETAPEVDAVVGVNQLDALPGIVGELFATGAKDKIVAESSFDTPPHVIADTSRLRVTPRHYAFLRITEGCDNRCAYCVIPDLRGPLRTKPIEAVLGEAEEMVADGAREIILVAQDTTAYGKDIYEDYRLPELISRVAEVRDLRWLRILYTHPAHYCEEFIDVFNTSDKILPYLDVPVQHASDRVLKAMGRGTTRARMEELFGKLRERIDGLVLRTTVIVGFPGEAREDFETTMDFAKRMRFDKLGAFTYSPETDTPAATMSGQVAEEEKNARLHELMTMQAGISEEINRGLVGKKLEAVIDGLDEEGRAIARTRREAPDVDGAVVVTGGEQAAPGEFVTLKITDAGPYDMAGVIA